MRKTYLDRSRPLPSQSRTSSVTVLGAEPNTEPTGVDIESAADSLLHLFSEMERRPVQRFVPITSTDLSGEDNPDDKVTVIQKKRKCC